MADSAGVKDVALRAGVSLGTVSNVLNRPERVSAATRAKVQQAIDELGFVRNEAARQLRAGRSRTIGVVVLDVGNPFFTDMAAGIEVAAEAAGLGVVLCNSGQQLLREDHYLAMLQEQRAFGILITPVTAKNPRIERIRRGGTPIVLLDRESSPKQCSVSVDDVAGGEMAMRHLLAQGHRRVAFLGGDQTINQVSDRLTGARAAMTAAGLDPGRLMVLETAGLTVLHGRAAGDELAALSPRRRPTAVFCANDLLALGLLQSMTGRQLQVPRDMAIVGYDDIDFAAAAAVPLTSVRQPSAQLGQAAAELLIEEVSAPATHRHRQVIFEPELVVRASTAAPEPGTMA
jgi:LacI family transcriptional regulator